MTEHFRKHGAIHALWAISILLLVVAWLLLQAPNGQLIGQYIGFAASVASLVLALVAIGYAFVSNQGFNQSVGALEVSSRDIRSAAQNIEEVSRLLSEKTEILTGEVSRVPDAVKALSEKIEENIAKSAEVPTKKQLLESSTVPYHELRNGAAAALYLIAQSVKHEKPFVLKNVFSEKDQIWAAVISGCIITIDGFKICGIEIDISGSDTDTSVKSMGSMDADEIIKSVRKRGDEIISSMRDAIDAYFSK